MKINKSFIKGLIINPFSVYAFAWIIPLVVYTLDWSTLFPPLSADLLLFLGVTICCSLIFGFVFQSLNIFKFYKIKTNIELIRKFLYASLFIVGAEFVVARHIPILSAIRGDGSSYTEFGLPIVHVLLINFLSFIFIYSFHCYVCEDNKKIKRKLMQYMGSVMVVFLLIFNRGAMMNCFIASGFIFLISAKSLRKAIAKFSVISLAILLGFGLLGNLRTDTKAAKNVILELGKATPEFRKSIIPDPFFWSYIYIASPLSNFQYNVTHNAPNKIDDDALQTLALYEFTPEIISKRVAPLTTLDRPSTKLVVHYFNVKTVYTNSFALMGWYGPFFLYIFSLFFAMVNIALVRTSSPYFLTSVAIINSIFVLNVFSNMYIFMGIVPQLIFPIIFSIKYLKKRRNGDSNTSIDIQ